MVRFANPNNINNLVDLHLKGNRMETIHTITTDDLTAKLNKNEIDILHFVESWLPTFSYWDVREFGWKLRMDADDVTAAVDMLILHGLLDVQTDAVDVGRIVSVLICLLDIVVTHLVQQHIVDSSGGGFNQVRVQ